MRYVPTFCLREGMVLSNSLWGNNGELILSRDVTLTEDYIKRIKKLNYNGIYIEDDLSKDLYISNIIDDRVRAQSVKCIKDVFIRSELGGELSPEQIRQVESQVTSIVDEILNNQNMMINMIDLKVFDDYTYYHSVNVAVLSIVLGVSLGLRRQELCDLGVGAILHDIGKIFVSQDILCKPGSLNEQEFTEMKKHSSSGYDYISKRFNISDASKTAILHHHEKFEGGGYPNNLKGEEISLYGRIISIADVYDAMTSDRPYRKGIVPSEVVEFLMGSTHSAFDPELVELFITKIAPYPIGTYVRLSNDHIGMVVKNYSNFCMRPMIRVFKHGRQDVKPYEVDLSNNSTLNITIVEVLTPSFQ
ncbi:HD-GYP domain-containing protein [Eubacteriaceae bacterium ES3]|nr:HD-GYP domain-containing protein [Eubacteriaceae bacterium ES3]